MSQAAARSSGKPLPAPGSLGAWMLAIRPKTLSASVMPVVVGAAYAQAMLASASGLAIFGWDPSYPEAWLRLLGAFVVGVGIQVGTNLVNDVADHFKGADTHERLGPPRVTNLGLLSPRAVVAGAIVSFSAAAVVGSLLLVTLYVFPGWWVFALGLLSIACGVLYTVGPKSIAYVGLGEVFVIGFFGVFATAGTALVLGALWWDRRVVLAGVAMGLLATGILEANNIRDIPTDAPVGKRTLAVRLGDRRARLLYAGVLAAPFVVVLFAVPWPWNLLPWLSLPLGLAAVLPVLRGAAGRDLIKVLQRNSLLEVLFGFLLAAATTLAWPAVPPGPIQ